MWSNVPFEIIESENYTFKHHFGKNTTSFSPRKVVQDYMKGRWGQEKYTKFINFSHKVEFLYKSGNEYKAKIKNVINNISFTEYFDKVVVATGHTFIENFPKFEGLENYQGVISHAKYFRSAKSLKDKVVLIVGSGFTSEDVGALACKYGALPGPYINKLAK